MEFSIDKCKVIRITKYMESQELEVVQEEKHLGVFYLELSWNSLGMTICTVYNCSEAN